MSWSGEADLALQAKTDRVEMAARSSPPFPAGADLNVYDSTSLHRTKQQEMGFTLLQWPPSYLICPH